MPEHIKIHSNTEDILLSVQQRAGVRDFNELLQMLAQSWLDEQAGERSGTMDAVREQEDADFDSDSLIESQKKHEAVLEEQSRLLSEMGYEVDMKKRRTDTDERSAEELLSDHDDSLDPVRRELYKRGYHKRGDR